jgi:glycosyltransferase involved in cell wall biosynthesis
MHAVMHDEALPRVSIGLPVFNGERYLEQTLDNILEQTFVDFELVIGDNASTDRTQKICQAYVARDRRIRYYRNERNLGAAPNHNLVFGLSSAEYFKWAGYDDRIAPNFLEKCVGVLDNRPEVVLCMPQSGMIDENGRFLHWHEYVSNPTSPKAHKRFQNLVLNVESGNHVYGLMRASAIRKTGLHGSYPASDLVFLAELALYGQFHVIPEGLFFRRVHSEQSTKGALSIERNRVLWFDTSRGNKILLPKWQYLIGYLRAIRNGPLSVYQRVFCYAQMIRWILYPPHFRALGKDLLIASRSLAIQALTKSGLTK